MTYIANNDPVQFVLAALVAVVFILGVMGLAALETVLRKPEEDDRG